MAIRLGAAQLQIYKCFKAAMSMGTKTHTGKHFETIVMQMGMTRLMQPTTPVRSQSCTLCTSVRAAKNSCCDPALGRQPAQIAQLILCTLPVELTAPLPCACHSQRSPNVWALWLSCTLAGRVHGPINNRSCHEQFLGFHALFHAAHLRSLHVDEQHAIK